MAIKFSNLASTTLASGVSDTATSLSVTSASLFPTLGGSDYFYATIGTGTGSEIVKVTAISGTTFTVVRGQDGTTAISHSSGAEFSLRVTAAALNDLSTQADTESVSIAGDTMTGNLSLGDNVKAQFGASDDLQIYHDGSRSYISDQGTGGLRLLTNEFSVKSPDESENLFFSIQDGSTYLYENGNIKLTTTSTGIDVTGSVVADGLTVDGGTASPIINLSRSGTYSGITFSQTVTNVTGAGADLSTYSLNANTGYVWQTTDSGGTFAKALLIAPNRDISFYDSSGSSQNFFWDSSTSRLGLGVTNPSMPLHLYTASSDIARFDSTSTTSNVYIATTNAATGNKSALYFAPSNSVAGAYVLSEAVEDFTTSANRSAKLVFGTRNNGSWGERLTINADGSSVFSGTVTGGNGAFSNLTIDATEKLRFDGLGGHTFIQESSNDTLTFATGGSTRLTLDANATFSGSVTSTGLTVNATGDAALLLQSSASSQTLRLDQNSIRTTTNTPINFLTNSTTALTLSTSQNVNIPNGSLMVGATTAPSELVHLKKTTGYQLRLEGSGSNKWHVSTGWSGYYENSFLIADTNAGPRLTIADNGNASFSGSVSVGGATPQGNLTIKGSASDDIDLLTFSEDGTNQSFSFNGNFAGAGSTGNSLSLDSYWQNDIMAWRGDGNVNIGSSLMVGSTTAPSTKLEVTGMVGSAYTATAFNARSAIKIKQADADTNYASIQFTNTTGTYEKFFGAVQTSTNTADMVFQGYNRAVGAYQEYLRIGETGNVGIGTSSPVTALEISTDGADHLTLNRADASININNVLGGIVVSADDPTANRSGAKIGFTAGANWTTNNFPTNIIFSNDASGTMTERMRIDSSGNLLVGTTSAYGTTGTTINAAGLVYSSADGDRAGQFDRTTSDGEIVRFSKAGSTVGSIGVIHGNNLFIGAPSHSGLQFGGSIIYPTNGTVGNATNGAVDLGGVSTRFKDLYLSNSAYVKNVGGVSDPDTYINFGDVANTTKFFTGGQEAARIDASQNLLVGNTDPTPYDRTSGNAIALGDGLISSAQSGGNAAIFNRMTNDGSIVGFRKDGSTVGSIGTAGGDIYIDSVSGGVGLLANAGTGNYGWTSSFIYPTTDNARDLGHGSFRFKDLFLSGKISTNTATGLSITADSSNRGILNLSTSQAYQLIGGTHYGYTGYKTGGYHRWFGSDGAEDMRIDSSGRVGIGTTAPDSILHIEGPASTHTTLRIESTTSGYDPTIVFASPANASGIYLDDNDTNKLKFYTGYGKGVAGKEITIDNEARLGIGTTAPTMPLSVQAASNAYAISMHGRSDGYSELYGASNDGSTKYSFLQSHSAQTKLYTLVNTPLLLGTNSTERMRIDSSGNVGIGSSSTDGRLKVSAASGSGEVGSIALYGNNGGAFGGSNVVRSKIESKTDGTAFGADMVFYTNDTSNAYQERMRITSSGNVGIGCSPPTGVRTKIKGLAEATNLATSATSAALFIEPYSGSSWGLGIGSVTGQKQYIQAVSAAGNGTKELLLQPFGGNVGIGTSSPSRQLSIYGTNDGYMSFNGGRAGNHEFVVGTDSAGFIIYDETLDTYRLVIDQDSGNVGIGTYSPARKLVVENDASTSDNSSISIISGNAGFAQLLLGDSDADVRGYLAYQNSDDSLQIGVNNSEAMRITSSGNVGIGTSSPNTVTNYTGLTLNNATYGGFIDIENNGTHTFRVLSNTTASYIGTIESDPLVFNTADTERMRLDSDGATIYNGKELRIKNPNGSRDVRLFNTSDYATLESTVDPLYIKSANAIRFDTNGNDQRMLIDNAGNLLVGKSSLNIGLTGQELRADGSSYFTSSGDTALGLNRLSSYGKVLEIRKDSAIVGSIGTPYAGELYIGGIGANSSGLLFTSGNTIQPRKNDAADNGNIDLGTSGNRFKDLYLSGAANIRTLAAQRGDAGTLIEATSSSGNGSAIINFMSSLASSSNNANCVHYQGTTQNINSWKLLGNGTSTWSSDINLKRDIETTRDGYLDDIKQLRVVKYKWKNDPDSQTELGLIAQEVEDIFPSLVTEDKNSVGDEVLFTEEDEIPTGKTVGDVKVEGSTYKGIKYGVIPLILLKAIQEQQTLIESLTARIAALEE
jgi:hypothetical protein